MRLSVKLYLGFAAVVLIALIQAAISLWLLRAMFNNAYNMANCYVPEMQIAAEISRQMPRVGSYISAYFSSFDSEDYDRGGEILDSLDDLQGKAVALVNQYPSLLSELGGLMARFRTALGEYRRYCASIRGLGDNLLAARETLLTETEAFSSAIAVMRGNFMEDYAVEKKNYEENFSRETAAQMVRRHERLAVLEKMEADLREEMSRLWVALATGDARGGLERADKGMGAIRGNARNFLADTRQEKNRPAAQRCVAAVDELGNQLTAYQAASLAIENEVRAMSVLYSQLIQIAIDIAGSGSNSISAGATSSEAAAQGGLKLQSVFMLLLLLAGIAVSFLVTRSVTRSLILIINHLNSSSDHVAVTSDGMRSASEGLAQGVAEQAASLESSSSALEQMASMTRQNADNATRGNEAMQAAGKLVSEGSGMIGRMSQAMSEINESSEKIGHIIKTIEEIAFQTNLLALNAAVEAARAGEAGKGFAVVADEVRNLAQRSAQAARDTSQLIEGTVARVHNGSEIVSQLTESYQAIENSAGNVARLIQDIATATHEQAQGVDQVNTAVAQMDKVTQTNSSNSGACASASVELAEEAEDLKSVVGELTTLLVGAARASQPVVSTRSLVVRGD
ncbi:MAG: methyl-accepting chemotaxis protein [Planctomycetes bacterium]|nr:methyl-accepting chemotaxis protein [Planctomycetota bacterium]